MKSIQVRQVPSKTVKRVRAVMGGGMDVNKNKFIEDWNSARENLEHNFRWTRRNLAIVGIFGIAVPILIYKGIVRDFHMQDEDAGRPPRKFIF
ncbi:neuronal acetylcholine receptor subunit alpha-5 [Cinnamomum micranthum f. kanehirae]|uniref:Neuronal acetylcholine receptor subunit alpha-5 n=1 Tax=Cinnamomum micranthum f. kanehirae TaxID=337451 RepID=A0A3S3MZV2_9MAGN|nr:neuronal acetylcholine receptor subunit alpha-5 [Cinnamomum micranthum f. kanehirae]